MIFFMANLIIWCYVFTLASDFVPITCLTHKIYSFRRNSVATFLMFDVMNHFFLLPHLFYSFRPGFRHIMPFSHLSPTQKYINWLPTNYFVPWKWHYMPKPGSEGIK
jgi:hypothetical protein